MSKKLAGGASHVLLDVKTGDGAFMEDPDEARALAELCVEIGEARGRRTGALVTDMSQPLGDGIGNALEVAVAIETLRGERHGRLRQLSLDLAAAALELTGVAPDDARDRVLGLLDDGSALERFRAFVVAQGGDPEVADRPWDLLPTAPVVRDWSPDGPAHHRVRLPPVRRARRPPRGRPAAAGRHARPRRRPGGAGAHGRRGGTGPAAVRVHARTDEDAEAVLAELPAVVHTGPSRSRRCRWCSRGSGSPSTTPERTVIVTGSCPSGALDEPAAVGLGDGLRPVSTPSLW
jgi:hypothetical protein